nr:hypothetical protein [Bacteroides intestinalis]
MPLRKSLTVSTARSPRSLRAFRTSITAQGTTPLSSRWTTIDPLAEKYYSVSPYADRVKHDNKLRFLNHNKVVNMLDNG